MEEEQKQDETRITISIEFDKETNGVKIASKALQDKIFMYGLLESAKLAVMGMQLSQQHKSIIPAHGIMNFVKNTKRF